MKDPLKKVEVEVELDVCEKLLQMENYTKLSKSELVNTALKRFISHHKDFFPSPAQHHASQANPKSGKP